MRTTTKDEIKDTVSTEASYLKIRPTIKRRAIVKRKGFDISPKSVSFRTIDAQMMEKLKSCPQVSISKRWAATKARAILAVDNIRPTQDGEKLAQAVENGEISYDEAVQVLRKRAYEYARQ
jgi:hypothetical protein